MANSSIRKNSNIYSGGETPNNLPMQQELYQSFIPAVVNLKDPDTIQYPVFAEFDSIFLTALSFATVNSECPPAPITVFAYTENVLAQLLNTQREVHLIMSFPNIESVAWKHAPPSVQLLRKLVYGHLCKLTERLHFHEVGSINDVTNLCNNFRPGVYLNDRLPNTLRHFPQKFVGAINSALHLAQCLYLQRNLSVLSMRDFAGIWSL